jgi:hypothetical protein
MFKNHPDHVLFETHDRDAPDVIKDCNGEVVLQLCKKCGRGEIDLIEPCTICRCSPEDVHNYGPCDKNCRSLIGAYSD